MTNKKSVSPSVPRSISAKMKRSELVKFIASSCYPKEDYELAKNRIQQRIRYAIASGALPRNNKFDAVSFVRWAKEQHDWENITDHPASPLKEEMITETGSGQDELVPDIPKFSLTKIEIALCLPKAYKQQYSVRTD